LTILVRFYARCHLDNTQRRAVSLQTAEILVKTFECSAFQKQISNAFKTLSGVDI